MWHGFPFFRPPVTSRRLTEYRGLELGLYTEATMFNFSVLDHKKIQNLMVGGR